MIVIIIIIIIVIIIIIIMVVLFIYPDGSLYRDGNCLPMYLIKMRRIIYCLILFYTFI